MQITKIVYGDGIEITNITSAQSDEILTLLLFPKVEKQPKPFMQEPVARKRTGYRAKKWTTTEDDFLRMSYRTSSAKAIAQKLNRSTHAVNQHIWKLGLNKQLISHD